jgi:hypothetical protein
MAEGDGMEDATGGGASQTVFVSYASHDTEIANTVCRELEKRKQIIASRVDAANLSPEAGIVGGTASTLAGAPIVAQ